MGQNRCFLALPMYWSIWNLSSCLICALEIFGLVQKLLEISLLMFSSCVHLHILGNYLVVVSKWYLRSYFIRYLCRCRIGPLYGVLAILPFQKFFCRK